MMVPPECVRPFRLPLGVAIYSRLFFLKMLHGVDTRPHRFADGSPGWKTPPASRYTLATGQTAICHPTKMDPFSKWVSYTVIPQLFLGYPHLWDEIWVI